MLIQAQKPLLLGRVKLHRLRGGQAACDPRLAGSGAALLTKFEFQLGDRGHDAGDGAPRRSAGVDAFPQGPHVDATAGQLLESRGDFADGASEPVYGDDHEVIALAEVTHVLRPARSVVTSATGRGVGEDPVGGDASRRDGVVLLIDGLLPGGHPEVRGGGHSAVQPAGSDNSSGVRFTGTRTRL